MRLILDEDLSRRLGDRLADPVPGSTHVATEGLLQAPDARLREYAKASGFGIVTADADFYELAATFGPPPKVIWLRACDYPTVVAERLIRRQAIRVAEFLQDRDQAVLILTP